MSDRHQRFALSVLLVVGGVIPVSLYPTVAGYALAVVIMLAATAIAAFDERVALLTVRNRSREIGASLLRPSKGKAFSWLAMALPITIWTMQWAEMIPESDGLLTVEVWGLLFFDAGESPLLFMSGLIGMLCRRSENG